MELTITINELRLYFNYFEFKTNLSIKETKFVLYRHIKK